MKQLGFACLALLLIGSAHAQEFNFTVKVNTQKLQTIDPKVFETLEQALTDFLNGQKWTDDAFLTEERIDANLTLTIQEEISPTTFSADLAIQSSRPIYGSVENTRVLNYLDNSLRFSYEQYQPLQFSKNSYQDNLTQILAFYIYLMLGMDYDTFAPLGGDPYYQTAQDIYNTVPSGVVNSDTGWKTTARRNRYWLLENFTSPRIRSMRAALYNYHRQGLDLMTADPATGRRNMLVALEDVQKANNAYPNSMAIQLFVDAKRDEIIDIFKGAPVSEQQRVKNLMSTVDRANSSKYRTEIQ